MIQNCQIWREKGKKSAGNGGFRQEWIASQFIIELY